MVAQHGFFARRGGKVFTPHSHQLNSPSSTATSTSSANHRRPGVGIGKSIPHKRHHRVPKDSIFGITKGDIRRLARRGGVKRISAGVYDVARHALKDYITDILHDCVEFVEHGRRKTVLVTDVIYALRRKGKPIYGFDNVIRQPARRRA